MVKFTFFLTLEVAKFTCFLTCQLHSLISVFSIYILGRCSCILVSPVPNLPTGREREYHAATKLWEMLKYKLSKVVIVVVCVCVGVHTCLYASACVLLYEPAYKRSCVSIVTCLCVFTYACVCFVCGVLCTSLRAWIWPSFALTFKRGCKNHHYTYDSSNSCRQSIEDTLAVHAS